jgi:aconitate hydratase
MGILPLVFVEGMSWQTLELTGIETVTMRGLSEIKPGQWIEAEITYADLTKRTVPLRARIDTFDELDYFRNGGILHYVLRSLAREAA